MLLLKSSSSVYSLCEEQIYRTQKYKSSEIFIHYPTGTDTSKNGHNGINTYVRLWYNGSE